VVPAATTYLLSLHFEVFFCSVLVVCGKMKPSKTPLPIAPNDQHQIISHNAHHHHFLHCSAYILHVFFAAIDKNPISIQCPYSYASTFLYADQRTATLRCNDLRANKKVLIILAECLVYSIFYFIFFLNNLSIKSDNICFLSNYQQKEGYSGKKY
jgi:hypothetical protein